MPSQLLGLAALLLAFAPAAQAPIPRELPEQRQVPVSIGLTLGPERYDFTGAGVCQHQERASISNTPAEQWTLTQSGAGRSVTLTVWRPLAGGEPMLMLNVVTSRGRYQVNSIQGAAVTGAGSVKIARNGAGASFTIDATTATGSQVGGIVTCEAFTLATSVPGN